VTLRADAFPSYLSDEHLEGGGGVSCAEGGPGGHSLGQGPAPFRHSRNGEKKPEKGGSGAKRSTNLIEIGVNNRGINPPDRLCHTEQRTRRDRRKSDTTTLPNLVYKRTRHRKALIDQDDSSRGGGLSIVDGIRPEGKHAKRNGSRSEII